MRFLAVLFLLLAQAGAGDPPTQVQPTDFCGKAAVALIPTSKLPGLPYTTRAKQYARAIPVTGEIIKEGAQLSKDQKEDGIYIYLVVRHGEKQSVVWSLRAPGDVGEEKHNLATHDSLFARAEEKLGHVEVLAAGQVAIANGQVARLDNRSYTRRGDAQRLSLAEAALSNTGLKFVDEGDVHTQRIDFNTSKNPDWDHHEDAEKIADIRSENDAVSSRVMTTELIRAWHQSVYERFPKFRHPTVPGHLDLDKLFAVDRLYPNRKATFEERVGILEAKDVFKIVQREGIELATRYMLTPEYDSYGNVPAITRIERVRNTIRLAQETP